MVHVPTMGYFDPVIALKNIPGQFQVTFVPRGSVKLNECELHLRMAGEDRFLVGPRTEVRKEEAVDEADAGVQQSAVARGTVVGNGALDHVAEVVQLVAPPLNFRCHAVFGAVSDIVRVQVPAWLLDSDNLLDDFVRQIA